MDLECSWKTSVKNGAKKKKQRVYCVFAYNGLVYYSDVKLKGTATSPARWSNEQICSTKGLNVSTKCFLFTHGLCVCWRSVNGANESARMDPSWSAVLLFTKLPAA